MMSSIKFLQGIYFVKIKKLLSRRRFWAFYLRPSNAKKLLPIVDKPLIQYAAEEAIAAGINTIFVTGK